MVNNILFVNCGTELRTRFNREPPNGLLTMAASLRNKGYNVCIYDVIREGDFIGKYEKYIKKYGGDFSTIGITSLTNTYSIAKAVASISKKHTDARVIYGGPHATFTPEESLRDTDEIDAIYCGEADLEIVSLVEQPEKTPNTFYRYRGKPVFTGYKPPPDLSEIPLPDRSILENSYDVASVIINRGCPFRCIYCVRQKLFSNVRFKPLYMVREEIEDILNYNYKFINFYDNINISRDYFSKFCDLLREMRIDIPFGCELRADRLSLPEAKQLRRAGCSVIGVGVESGVESVVRSGGKYQKPELVRKGIRNAKKAGLNVQAYFVIGLPGETWKSFYKTLEYVEKLGLVENEDKINFFIATPYPGSELREKSCAFGIKILSNNYDLYDTYHAVISTRILGQNELIEMKNIAKSIEKRFWGE